MKICLGLHLGSCGAAAELPDAANTLSLTGYWRANATNYAASPWTGTASAGTSGGRNLTEATNPPAAGTAQNGFVPADFDGTNDILAPAATTLDTFANALAFSGWALIRPDSVAGPTYIVVDEFSAMELLVFENKIQFLLNESVVAVTRTLVINEWQLVTWRYDGVNLQVGVNEVPGATGGVSTTAYSTAIGDGAITRTGAVAVGNYTAGGAAFNGRILEVSLSDAVLTNQNFTDVIALISTRYSLTLTPPAVYDPTTLNLTGYWRASYAGTPWVGTASGGTSANQNASHATQAPAVGALVNGYAPADFGGLDRLTLDDTLDTYVLGTTFNGWALMWSDLDEGLPLSDPSNSTVLLNYDNDVAELHLNNSAVIVSRACPSGAWQLVTWRYYANVAAIGVNEAPGAAGGASTAAYAVALTPLTGDLRMGDGFDGRFLEFAISDEPISNDNFANVKAYINQRYGLSL